MEENGGVKIIILSCSGVFVFVGTKHSPARSMESGSGTGRGAVWICGGIGVGGAVRIPVRGSNNAKDEDKEGSSANPSGRRFVL